MIKLDLTDRKILHELDFNSRQPISRMAKKLGLSREIVSYRMNKFLSEKLLIKYRTIMDISKLGYTAQENYIRFQNMPEEKEKEIIKYIKENPNIIHSFSCDGRFDIVVIIWAKNIKELNRTLKEIDLKFGGHIAERDTASVLQEEYCVRDYLIGKETSTKKRISFRSMPQQTKIDDIDKKILVELGKDARIPSVEIANKIKLSADAVYKRIKKLESFGVVQNYDIVLNEEIFPYLHYKVLFSLSNFNDEKQKKLEQYCRKDKNIKYFCTILGPWNFEADINAESQAEFRNILRNIKLNFSDIIKDYIVLPVYKTNKYNFCPSIP